MPSSLWAAVLIVGISATGDVIKTPALPPSPPVEGERIAPVTPPLPAAHDASPCPADSTAPDCALQEQKTAPDK